MTSSILRRIENWSTRRRSLALLAVAAAGMVASTTVPPGTFEAIAAYAAEFGLTGVYVYEASAREQCEECDERVYSALRYCDSCGHETGCDHDVFKEDGPICPVCGEDQ